MIVPGFFSLTVAGVILAVAVRSTGNLFFDRGACRVDLLVEDLQVFHAWCGGFPRMDLGHGQTHRWLDGFRGFVGNSGLSEEEEFLHNEENGRGEQAEVNSGKTGTAAKHFLYPSVCQICEANRAVSDEGLICADCREGVRPLTSPYCVPVGCRSRDACPTRLSVRTVGR